MIYLKLFTTQSCQYVYSVTVYINQRNVLPEILEYALNRTTLMINILTPWIQYELIEEYRNFGIYWILFCSKHDRHSKYTHIFTRFSFLSY